MKFALTLPLFLLFLCFLSACSSTRVILLEHGEKQNAVVVSTDKGEQLLDQVNTYTDMGQLGGPAPAKAISAEQIEQSYGGLLAVVPKSPVSFLLYFEASSTELTPESLAQVEEIKAALAEREPCAVSIIGHTDSVGSKDYNARLSLERAQQIYDWLLEQNLNLSAVAVDSYGEIDQLIPTDDEVSEPRNRRVEIQIR